jgi:hypothetical protein
MMETIMWVNEEVADEDYEFEVILEKEPIKTDQGVPINACYEIDNIIPTFRFYGTSWKTIVHESLHGVLDFCRRIGLSIKELTDVGNSDGSLGEEIIALYQQEFIDKIISSLQKQGAIIDWRTE